MERASGRSLAAHGDILAESGLNLLPVQAGLAHLGSPGIVRETERLGFSVMSARQKWVPQGKRCRAGSAPL